MVSNLEIHTGWASTGGVSTAWSSLCSLFPFFFSQAIHHCVLKSHHVLIFKKQNETRKTFRNCQVKILNLTPSSGWEQSGMKRTNATLRTALDFRNRIRCQKSGVGDTGRTALDPESSTYVGPAPLRRGVF